LVNLNTSSKSQRHFRVPFKTFVCDVAHLEAYLAGRFPLHGVEDIMSVLTRVYNM